MCLLSRSVSSPLENRFVRSLLRDDKRKLANVSRRDDAFLRSFSGGPYDLISSRTPPFFPPFDLKDTH